MDAAYPLRAPSLQLPLVLPARWRSLLVMTDPPPVDRPGPPGITSATLATAVQELRPLMVFAPDFLPGDVILDGTPCELHRLDNPTLSLMDRRVAEACDGLSLSAPVVLAANVGASGLGRLRHRLGLVRRAAILIALGAQKVACPGLPSDSELAACAQVEWGHHVVQEAHSLTAMGAPTEGPTTAAGRVQMMALQFHCSSHPFRGAQPPLPCSPA